MRLLGVTALIGLLTACAGLSEDFEACGCDEEGQVCIMDPFDGNVSFQDNVLAGSCEALPANCEPFYDAETGLFGGAGEDDWHTCTESLCPDPNTAFSSNSSGGEIFVQCSPL